MPLWRLMVPKRSQSTAQSLSSAIRTLLILQSILSLCLMPRRSCMVTVYRSPTCGWRGDRGSAVVRAVLHTWVPRTRHHAQLLPKAALLDGVIMSPQPSDNTSELIRLLPRALWLSRPWAPHSCCL